MTAEPAAGWRFAALRATLPSPSWCAMCFLGACVLLPYNSLLTAQAFFDEHAFKDMKFPFTSMMVYSLCLSTAQVVLTFKGEALTIRSRMQAAFASCFVACAALTVCSLAAHFRNGSGLLCTLCLLAVAVTGVSNALLQTAVLGVAGAMGPDLSAAVMVGLGVSGLLSLGVSLVVQGLETAAGVSEATGEAGVIVAVVLFTFCILYALVSVWVYFDFLSHRDARTSEAMAQLEEQRAARRLLQEQQSQALTAAGAGGGAAREVQLCAEEASGASQSRQGAGGSRGLLVLKEVAPQALNVCGVFVVTMCVFPGVVTQWKPGPNSAFKDSQQLFVTLSVGAFQVCDVLSRMAAGWVTRCVAPPRLWMWVALRFAFIPLFMLGQLRPELCALWGSDLGRFLLCGGLAFSNGLFASCAMMFGPARAAEERRENAGIAMSCVMVIGIFLGTLCALLTQIGNPGTKS